MTSPTPDQTGAFAPASRRLRTHASRPAVNPARALLRLLCGVSVLTLTLADAPLATARDIYVQNHYPTGDNGNPGTETAPYRTIGQALLKSQPYDTIYVKVGDGPYVESVTIQNQNNLSLVGVNDANGHQPIIQNPSVTSTRLVGIIASHDITFRNFEVDGTGITRPDTNGIAVYPDVPSSTVCYNIDIKYNTVHDFGEAGIAFNAGGIAVGNSLGADNITITGNVVYKTNSYSSSASSGISVLSPRKAGSGWTPAAIMAGPYTVVIQNNYVHDNTNWSSNLHTDCNGIILDTGTTLCPKTLIQNNVVCNNSGRGVYLLNSCNADVFNNTCYQNLRDTQVRDDAFYAGEVVAVTGYGQPLANVRILNNLAYGRWTTTPALNVNTKDTTVNSSVNASYNLSYVGTANVLKTGGSYSNNKYGQNPLLVGPLNLSTIPVGNFRLSAGSPAILAGSPTTAASTDYDWVTRTHPSDIGAFKY